MNPIDLGVVGGPTSGELAWAKRLCKRLNTRKTPEQILAMDWKKFEAFCKRKGLKPVFRKRPYKTLKVLTILSTK